jgi:hypothetical protein
MYTEKMPFPDKHDVAVILAVLKGERPERPLRVSDNLWNITELCWAQEPKDRPDMKKLLDIIRDMDFGVDMSC